jgi:nucleoside-diphosphate-sugar epimerase
MRIWVTGARGFIGRHVVAQAVLAGHEVWALARPGVSRPSDLPPSAHLLGLDLADGREIASLVKSLAPEVIIHLAWYARPQDYLTSLDNVDSLSTALCFAKAALLAGCRTMVGVGTCLEYADSPRAHNESDLLDPKSLYARCKRAAHLVLGELFDRQGARLIWARLFHMHGPGENPARLLPAVIAALRSGRAFSLSPGEQIRDHLDVRDVASALVHLAGSDLKGAVNVCSGIPVKLRAVLEILGRELGRPELLHFARRPYLADEVMFLTGIPARLSQSGWRPAHADLAASIRETIAATGTTI